MILRHLILLTLISIYSNSSLGTSRAYTIQGANRTTEISPLISLLGDQVFAERFHFLNIHFAYSIPTDLVSTTVTGSGSVTYSGSDNMALLRTGTANGAAVAKLVSLRNFIPIPFSEVYLYLIAGFDTSATSGTNQWVGMFDDADGFAVGCSEAEFSILYRRSEVDAVIRSTEFNVDKLDGSGPSRVMLDPSKINLFRISYGWMGSTQIVFEVLAPEGSWYPFHVLSKLNYTINAVLSKPILPVSATVTRVSGKNDVTMRLVALGMGSIGKRQASAERNYSSVRNDFSVAINQTKPVLTVRNKPMVSGKTNRMEVQISMVSLSSDVNARFWLTKNPTLTNSRFSDVDSNSCMEVDMSATAVNGGTQLLSFFNIKGGHENIFLKANNFNITLLPGESLSVVVTALGTGCNTDVTVNWNEVY